MSLVTLNRNPSDRQVQRFARYWLSGALLVTAGVAGLRYGSWPAAAILATCAAASVAVGILRPSWLRPVLVALSCLTFPLGWLMAHALLGVIYYGMIVPLGLAMRFLGHDPLARRLDRQATSYWSPCEARPELERYFRPF